MQAYLKRLKGIVTFAEPWECYFVAASVIFVAVSLLGSRFGFPRALEAIMALVSLLAACASFVVVDGVRVRYDHALARRR